MNAILGALARHLIALVGGVSAGSNEEIGEAVRNLIVALANGDTNAWVGAVLVLASVGWSIFDKAKKNKKNLEDK